MKKLLLLSALLSMMSGMANAAQLSPEQALSRLNAASGRAVNSEMKLVYTASQGPDRQFYIFNNGGDDGFAIVSADDCITPLIGYAYSGSFDPDNIPPNMLAWLAGYRSQIEAAIAAGETIPKAKTAARGYIAPLVTTRWNQEAPYNNKCPMDGTKRSVTGCVATAMAQVMKFHNWPPKGSGSNSYSWTNSAKEEKTLSIDFSAITFDWDNMTDTYGSGSSQAQDDAVATLMEACGYSVNMNYSGAESGAASPLIAYALAQYFDYDGEIQFVMRDFFGIEEWEDMIYAELAAKRPVIYDGSTASGSGHEFVCDGYDNGYFHFNWGWGGMSDGFFKLTLLSPAAQGVGGSNSGYNFSQGATIGIRKKTSPAAYDPKPYITASEFTVDDAVFKSKGSATFIKSSSTITFGSLFINMSAKPVAMNFGIKCTPVGSGVPTYRKCAYTDDQLADDPFHAGSGLKSFPMYASALPASGTWTITPAYYDIKAKEWRDILVPISNPVLTMTCTSRNIKISMESATGLTAENLQFLTPVFAKSPYKISADIEVSGKEYHGNISAILYKSGTDDIAATCSFGMADFLPDEKNSFEGIGNFESLNITEETEYDFVIADNAGKPISGRVKVKVSPAVSETSYTITDITFPGASVVDNVAVMPCDKISISAKVACSKGYLASQVAAYLFPNTSGNVYSLTAFISEPLYIKAGDNATVTLNGAYGIPGEYIICFRTSDGWSRQMRVNLTEVSAAIDEVSATEISVSINQASDIISVSSPGTIDLIEIYSLTGARMAEVNPGDKRAEVHIGTFPAGHYVARVISAGHIVTKRIIKF